MSFTCPRCAMISHHPQDEEHGYCGACHDFTGDPPRTLVEAPQPEPSGLDRAIAHLAKQTVAHGWDPGQMVTMLMRAVKFRNEVWPHLSPEVRAGVLAELRRRQSG